MGSRRRRTTEGRDKAAGQAAQSQRTTPARNAAAAGGRTVGRMGIELYRITVELLRMPAAIYMRAAERAGGIVLAGWLALWLILARGWKLAGRTLAVAERQVTPGRATLVVGAAAAVALAASQFVDYRSITIGTSAYIGVEGVAPPPEVGSSSAGAAHAWAGLPLAAFALFILAACALGRWRAARLLIPIGIAVVAISLLIDRPKGLDEGDAAIAYDGASATLLGGFWAQLVSGVLLVAVAPLLIRQLDPRAAERDDASEPTQRRLPRLRRPAFLRNRPATGASR